ncbi:MAG: hypothetical protein ABIC18_05335 [Candidatus Omnitrophota bacterium]
MSGSSLKAYIKTILFRKRSAIDLLFPLYVITLIILPIFAITNIITFKAFSIAIGAIFAAVVIAYVIYSSIIDYNFYKKYEYNKDKIPESFQKIRPNVDFETYQFLRQIDERIKAIEQYAPIRFGIYAFFLSIIITIAVSVILR